MKLVLQKLFLRDEFLFALQQTIFFLRFYCTSYTGYKWGPIYGLEKNFLIKSGIVLRIIHNLLRIIGSMCGVYIFQSKGFQEKQEMFLRKRLILDEISIYLRIDHVSPYSYWEIIEKSFWLKFFPLYIKLILHLVLIILQMS